jgi:hypothetical protein
VAKNAELPRAVAEIKCPESGPRPVAIRETMVSKRLPTIENQLWIREGQQSQEINGSESRVEPHRFENFYFLM